MKIVRFVYDGSVHYGLWEAEVINFAEGSIFSGLKPTGRTVSYRKARILAPLDPPNIYAIGLNYRQHAAEGGVEAPESPIVFMKATTSVIGPEQAIVLPLVDRETIDYEAELAVIIGKTARDVSEQQAPDYVLGFTCGNDVSCRAAQRADKQWVRAKSFDTFCPLGPCIQTDLDPENTPIKSRLNGISMQDSNTSNMIFNYKKLISYLSQSRTLLPGTVILTGTPEGVGFARKPPVYLKQGDTIEIELEGIGVLSNPVVAEK